MTSEWNSLICSVVRHAFHRQWPIFELFETVFISIADKLQGSGDVVVEETNVSLLPVEDLLTPLNVTA